MPTHNGGVTNKRAAWRRHAARSVKMEYPDLVTVAGVYPIPRGSLIAAVAEKISLISAVAEKILVLAGARADAGYAEHQLGGE